MAAMVSGNLKMNVDNEQWGALPPSPPSGVKDPRTPINADADASAKESCFNNMGGSGASEFESGIYCGYEVSVLATEFWQNLDEKTRKYMLWDVPYMARRDTLRQCWHNADCVCLAWTGPNKLRLSAAAWITRIGPGSKCGMAHFCFARQARPLAYEIGREMLDLIFLETQFYSLIGLVPVNYRAAINFAKNLGFMQAARLSNACNLVGRKWNVMDGALLTLNLMRD